MEGTCAGAGEQCEEEGVAEELLWTRHSSHFPSPAQLKREKTEQLGVKWCLKKRKEGRCCFVLFFFTIQSLLIGYKLIFAKSRLLCL